MVNNDAFITWWRSQDYGDRDAALAAFAAGEQAGLKKHLELLSEAAPLRWVFSQDMDGAREWEVKAAAILSLITDKEIT